MNSSCRKKEMLSMKQDALENLIEYEVTNDTKIAINKISFHQNELENLVQNRTKVATVKRRARWAENGEKNTKFFLNLEKRKYDNKVIHKLKCAKVLLIQIKNQKVILAQLVDYYKQVLYNREAIIPNRKYTISISM